MNRETLIYYAIKYQGNYALITKAIKQNEVCATQKLDQNAITILDEQYPKCLKDLNYPP